MGLSVFQRFQEAVSASESIPAIIAEIDALLPEGYCVAKRSTVNEAHIEGVGGITLTSLPVEDMSDWRNWREGDLVECISTDDDGAGGLIGIEIGDVRPITGISEKFGVRTSKYSWGKTKAYRFHSRPEKVAE